MNKGKRKGVVSILIKYGESEEESHTLSLPDTGRRSGESGSRSKCSYPQKGEEGEAKALRGGGENPWSDVIQGREERLFQNEIISTAHGKKKAESRKQERRGEAGHQRNNKLGTREQSSWKKEGLENRWKEGRKK